MKIPEKFYRIYRLENGYMNLFDTEILGEPNNWFCEEKEANQWIAEVFKEARLDTNDPTVLIVLPTYTVKL